MQRVVLSSIKNQANLTVLLLAALLTDVMSASISRRLLTGDDSKIAFPNRSWWIPNRIPEYLTVNVAKDSGPSESNTNSVPVPASAPITAIPEVIEQTKEPTPAQVQPQEQQQQPPQPQPALVSKDVIQFTKYQQPEPKHPDGIRFPATVPVLRNKYGIKPRFDNGPGYLKN